MVKQCNPNCTYRKTRCLLGENLNTEIGTTPQARNTLNQTVLRKHRFNAQSRSTSNIRKCYKRNAEWSRKITTSTCWLL